MKRILLIILLLNISLSVPGTMTPLQLSIFHPAQLFPESFNVYGLRINLVSGKNTNMYGIDLGLANRVGRDMIGIQAGVVLNKVENMYSASSVKGIQIAGGYNGSTGRMYGIQIAGLINGDHLDFYGIQLSGIMNGECRDFYGIQISALNYYTHRITGLNLGFLVNATGNFYGIQIAGLVNHTSKGYGIQFAGLFNMAKNVFSGLQISCLGNRVGDDNENDKFHGLQIGAVNRVAGVMTGLQIGVVNSARKTRGVQIGLVNYCHRMRGLQIGLINIIRDNKIPVLPLFNAGSSW